MEEYNKKENAKRLREGLENHINMVAEKGRAKYSHIDSLETLAKVLQDSNVIRFPTLMDFDENPPEAGTFARLEAPDDEAANPYRIYIHPLLKGRDKDVIDAALYMVVKVNYGKIAKDYEAVLFASQLLGIEEDEYRERIERLRTELA